MYLKNRTKLEKKISPYVKAPSIYCMELYWKEMFAQLDFEKY